MVSLTKMDILCLFSKTQADMLPEAGEWSSPGSRQAVDAQ